MKIAHVAPLTESIPPRGYGGIERVVSYITEELVRRGHEVTLFASGDSQTAARLAPCSTKALGYDISVNNPIPYYAAMLKEISRRAREFDVLHFHFDFLHFMMLRDCKVPMVTTLHGWPYMLDLLPFYSYCFEKPLISISLLQRSLLPHFSWLENVYHGIPLDLYSFNGSPQEDYLVFLGRICSEKGPDEAIAIAKLSGMKLRIAGNVKQEDRCYFERSVAPLLDDPLIEFVGEVQDDEKARLLGGARALVFPIKWPEPFGLVMIEAMACGTPVIGYCAGSVPEVVEQGVTGFIVENARQAAEAILRLDTLDRARVRDRFEARFSVQRMVDDYLAIYQRQIKKEKGPTLAGQGRNRQSRALAELTCRHRLPSETGITGSLLNRKERPKRSFQFHSRRGLWVRLEYESGLLYATDRAKGWSAWKRLLYVLGAPLIPVIRLSRILKQLYVSGVIRDLLWSDILLAPIGLIFSAFGEMVGYARGAGRKSGRPAASPSPPVTKRGGATLTNYKKGH